MSKNAAIEIEGRARADFPLRSVIWRAFNAVAVVGPDLMLSGVMAVVLIATLTIVGGHIRFFQASLGFPVGIMLTLVLYRTFIHSNMATIPSVRGILRDWLPFLFVTFIYENLHDLSGHFSSTGDIAGSLYQWDIAIFGVEPTIWAQKFYSPLLTDIMAISYALYFILPLVLMFFLTRDGLRPEFRRISLALTFAFLTGFIGYVVWPASPPRYFIINMFTDPVKLHGLFIFDRLQGSWDTLSVISCGAFPSLHVGISTIALIYTWQFRKIDRLYNWMWWLYIPLATSLWFSTVYLRHHWVVDIFAGLIVAIVCFVISEYVLSLWQEFRVRCGLPSIKNRV